MLVYNIVSIGLTQLDVLCVPLNFQCLISENITKKPHSWKN